MYPCSMGLSCSKSKAGRDVLRSRADTLSRGQMAQPSSLAELCISALADHHERLCATDIEQRIGTNVAQRLLNALIQRGKLNHAVAAMFASAHLWQVELPNHPGIGSDLFELLSSGSLTVIDLSGTQVRFPSHKLSRYSVNFLLCTRLPSDPQRRDMSFRCTGRRSSNAHNFKEHTSAHIESVEHMCNQ